MKMFKNALLLGGMMATFALTSCLKGGNSASYTAIGTVSSDKYGNTVFYADNAGVTYRPDNNILSDSENRRITCKMDINYDNQSSNDYILTTISEVKKLNEQYIRDLNSTEDTLGMSKDTLFVTPITSSATVCIQQKQYYINLNINYLAQKKDAGPEHEFTIYNDVTKTNESKTDIYLLLVHHENGEIPGGKEMKTALETYDITTLVNDKEKKTQGKVHLTFHSSKGDSKVEMPFVNYDFNQQ